MPFRKTYNALRSLGFSPEEAFLLAMKYAA